MRKRNKRYNVKMVKPNSLFKDDMIVCFKSPKCGISIFSKVARKKINVFFLYMPAQTQNINFQKRYSFQEHKIPRNTFKSM